LLKLEIQLCFTKHKPHACRNVSDHTSPRYCAFPSPPAATEWSRLMLHDVICSERATMHFQRGRNLSVVTLTFDIAHWHSNSSERRTKYVFTVNLAQIRSAVQRFPRYFIHKQKSHRQRQKQNVTQFTVCGNRRLRGRIIRHHQ